MCFCRENKAKNEKENNMHFASKSIKKCTFKNGLFVRSISKDDPMGFLSPELIDYFDLLIHIRSLLVNFRWWCITSQHTLKRETHQTINPVPFSHIFHTEICTYVCSDDFIFRQCICDCKETFMIIQTCM